MAKKEEPEFTYGTLAVIFVVIVLVGTMISQAPWFFLLLFAGIGFLVYKWVTAWSPAAKVAQRRATPLSFDCGVSESEFDQIVRDAGRQFRGADSIARAGSGDIVIQWQSHSGKSFYEALLDFNDSGHLSGKYYVMSNSGPDNSDMVDRIGEYISGRIVNKAVQRV